MEAIVLQLLIVYSVKVNKSRYCIICGQRIYQKALINWFCRYLSFLNIFFNRFCPLEKSGVTPRWLYRDSLTLICRLWWQFFLNFTSFPVTFAGDCNSRGKKGWKRCHLQLIAKLYCLRYLTFIACHFHKRFKFGFWNH